MMFILYHIIYTANLLGHLMMCILYLITIYIKQTNPNQNIINNSKLMLKNVIYIFYINTFFYLVS